MAELTTLLRQRGHVKSKLIGLKRLVDRISSSEAKEEDIFELNQYLIEVENLIREFDDYHMKIILKVEDSEIEKQVEKRIQFTARRCELYPFFHFFDLLIHWNHRL
jgi:hypothetical protein